MSISLNAASLQTGSSASLGSQSVSVTCAKGDLVIFAAAEAFGISPATPMLSGETFNLLGVNSLTGVPLAQVSVFGAIAASAHAGDTLTWAAGGASVYLLEAYSGGKGFGNVGTTNSNTVQSQTTSTSTVTTDTNWELQVSYFCSGVNTTSTVNGGSITQTVFNTYYLASARSNTQNAMTGVSLSAVWNSAPAAFRPGLVSVLLQPSGNVAPVPPQQAIPPIFQTLFHRGDTQFGDWQVVTNGTSFPVCTPRGLVVIAPGASGTLILKSEAAQVGGIGGVVTYTGLLANQFLNESPYQIVGGTATVAALW